MGFKRKVPWPVHFTSTIYDWNKIKKGVCCDPADNPGIYINACGGLTFGDDIEIGPNTVITTVNHSKYDYRKIGFKKGIVNLTLSPKRNYEWDCSNIKFM